MPALFTSSVRIVKVADPDGSQVPVIVATGAIGITVGATCDTASETLTYRLIFTDLNRVVVGVSGENTLTSVTSVGFTIDWGNSFLGNPAPEDEPVIPVCGDLVFLKVDTVTGGTWTIATALQFPPGQTG